MALAVSRYKIFIVILFIFITWFIIRYVSPFNNFDIVTIDHGPSATGDITPVSVKVFYEALCPDSKNFIIRHLLPTVERAPRLLSISLVPYGKAKVDLIGMQSEPDGEYKFIFNYQDHLTKFVVLRPLKTKTADKVSDFLLDIFCLFGAPYILHSNNGREFCNRTEEDSAGALIFSCQHGQTECHANKVHACAIEKIHHTHSQVKYIACMITNNFNPEAIGEKCSKDLNIDWAPILNCVQSGEGDRLLRSHGESTHALRPAVSFIPTVLLDGEVHRQSAILKDLFKEVCLLFKILPPECDIYKEAT